MTAIREPRDDPRALKAELTRLNNQMLTIQRELEKKNAAMERLAYYDTLTGLLNRRAILEKLTEWLRHVQRYKSRLAIAMLDIDHFKLVNDSYGHRIGDRVLSDLADLMRRSIRTADFVGRYGGEEFLLILPNTDAAGASIVAERVRAHIEGTPMHDTSGRTFKTTVSLGAAEYCSGDDEDLLIGRADTALYRAKDLGRNRVVVSSCPPADSQDMATQASAPA